MAKKCGRQHGPPSRLRGRMGAGPLFSQRVRQRQSFFD